MLKILLIVVVAILLWVVLGFLYGFFRGLYRVTHYGLTPAKDDASPEDAVAEDIDSADPPAPEQADHDDDYEDVDDTLPDGLAEAIEREFATPSGSDSSLDTP